MKIDSLIIFLCISNFDLILYLNSVLLFLCCHGFYTLFDFKRFQAPPLGFSLIEFIGGSWEPCWKWTLSCSNTFRFLFCSVLSVSFRVVCYYVMYSLLEKSLLIYFLDFMNYCFSLHIDNLFCTILWRFHLSFE